MTRVLANNIAIEVEEYGDPSNPPVLLIMGLAGQLIYWPPAFIDGLVKAGFYVIAFDNRDIGLSEKLHAKSALNPLAYLALSRFVNVSKLAPYTLVDMAADTAGVLDALSIEKAHVIGVSMGGMIGQVLAANDKDRVKSFTAIMSTTNNPSLPKADQNLVKELFVTRTQPRTRKGLVDRSMHLWSLIGTKDGGNDPVEFRKRLEAAVDRCTYPQGVRRQIAAIIATGDLRRWTKKIEAPTLVVHGAEDPLTPFKGGLDIAANVSGARAEIIDGMGHDLPPKYLPKILEFVTDHLKSVEKETASVKAA